MTQMASRYIERVKSLFGLEETPDGSGGSPPRPAARAPDKPPPRPAAQPPAAEPDNQAALQEARTFEAGLRDLAAGWGSNENLISGRIQLINIEQIRARMGDRWPRVESRVHERIRTILKARLSSATLHRRIGDTYVLVFGDCSETEARLRAAMLTEEIMEDLVGGSDDSDLALLELERLVTSTSGQAAERALESADALSEMLHTAQAEARSAGTPPSRHAGADARAGRRALRPDEVAALLSGLTDELDAAERSLDAGTEILSGDGSEIVVAIDRVKSLLRNLKDLETAMRPSEIRFEQQAETGAGTPSADPGWSEMAGGADTAWFDGMLAQVAETRERANRQMVMLYEQAPESVGREPAQDQLSVDFGYWPMWHAPSKKVAIYVSTATLRQEDERLFRCSNADERSDVLAILDRLALRRAQMDMNNATRGAIPNIVMVPIHVSTLQRAGSSERFLMLCRHLTEAQRMALTWEIVDAHVDSWSLQLKALVKPLKLFGRTVFLRLPAPEAALQAVRINMPYLRDAGIRAVGVDITGLEGDESEQLAVLESVAEAAERAGLNCYGHGFESLSQTICAVCMGFQHVSGPAIGGLTEQPEGVRAAELGDIYGRMLFSERDQGDPR